MKYIHNWNTYLNEVRKPKEIQEPEEFPENALHFLVTGSEMGNSMIAAQMINYKPESSILQGWLVWLKRIASKIRPDTIKYHFSSQKPLTALLEMIQWLQGKKINGPVLQKYTEIVLNSFGFCDGDYFYAPIIQNKNKEYIYRELLNCLLDENGLMFRIYPNNNFTLDSYHIQGKFLKNFKNTETFENIIVKELHLVGTNSNHFIQDLTWIGPSVEKLSLIWSPVKNLKGCPAVRKLEISNCDIETLQGIPSKLEFILLVECPKLKSLQYFPVADRAQLSKLEIFTLDGLPDYIGELLIYGCNNLTSLRGVPKKLESLVVKDFSSGRGLTDIIDFPDEIQHDCELEFAAFEYKRNPKHFNSFGPELKKRYPNIELQILTRH